MTTHVEAHDFRAFCGETSHHTIRCEEWHDDPSAITRSTCRECLERLIVVHSPAALIVTTARITFDRLITKDQL